MDTSGILTMLFGALPDADQPTQKIPTGASGKVRNRNNHRPRNRNRLKKHSRQLARDARKVNR